MYSQIILITGSRNWSDKNLIHKALQEYVPVSNSETILLIHGACRGADNIAGDIANKLGFSVSFELANWKKYGKSAGIIRNLEMIKLVEKYKEQKIPVIVLAFHDNLIESKGTKHCVNECLKKEIKVKLYRH